ncbi:MAG: formamidopyrimidine-DNA glycosylase [bacterium]|nr:formamidopyrimidine-DNA glycosylase [bacterium]
MPELPDVEAYLHALRREVVGRAWTGVRLKSPFLLRSVEPPLAALTGRTIDGVRRLGKRIIFEFAPDDAGERAGEALFMVLHLMIAGRLRWKKAGAGLPGKMGLAAFDFEHGTLMLTEASSKKRASLYVVRGEEGLAAHDPGGIDPFACDAQSFGAALTRANHTIKRALTDPRIFSGIGNAYSDEILHAAHMSPFKRTQDLEPAEVERLLAATRDTLELWRDRFVADAEKKFPDKVTAFRPEMAVHGKYGEPCPECEAPVQRIVYASNEANYCARCQTGGKLLADRALSRLLKDDWPKTLEELE